MNEHDAALGCFSSSSGSPPGDVDAVGRHRMVAPSAVRWIARTLEEAGFETWAVGGAVRDALAGLPGGDWDLTTRARPEDMRQLFRRTVPIGVEHGTVGVLTSENEMFEVTTFRRDVETFGRHAVVEFADELDDDLARRDFTINAVAWHPLRRELRDPYGGVGDLERRLLRTVGEPAERFGEDYLRVLRGLRFAGRFDLTIERATWRSLCEGAAKLPGLSAERIREELTKVLEGEARPSRALALYAASGALAVLYPELDALVGTTAAGRPPQAPPPGGERGIDAWSRGILMADGVAPARLEVRLACVLHGAGLPRQGRVGGETLRERATLRAAAVLERLRFSKARIARVAGVVGAASAPPLRGASPAELRRWLASVDRRHFRDVVAVWSAGARVDDAISRTDAAAQRTGEHREMARERVAALRAELLRRPPLAVADLEVDGRDFIAMGMKPGPHFGDVLSHLLELVLEDPARNEREGLLTEVESFLEGFQGGGRGP